MGAAYKISSTENLSVNNISTANPIATKPVVELTDVKDAFIQGCFPLKGSKSFVSIDGAETNNIILSNNSFIRLTTAVEKGNLLKKSAAIIE